MPVKLVTIFLSMALALAALTGCSAPHMHPATPRAIVPDPAAATVVFVRPSVLGAAITPVIATTAGRFLGETEARSYFVTKLAPGTYTFLSWSESTPAMQATLAPGLVYYVEVDPRMGFGSARVQLLALGPRREGWSKLVDWLSSAHRIEADEDAGAAHLRDRHDDFAERVHAADESYRGYSAEDRDARTLRADDGVPRAIGSAGAGAADRVESGR